MVGRVIARHELTFSPSTSCEPEFSPVDRFDLPTRHWSFWVIDRRADDSDDYSNVPLTSAEVLNNDG